MKKISRYLLGVFGLVLALTMAHGLVRAEEPAADAEHEALMAQWQQAASPNENHQRLEPLVGSWKHTVKWRMSPDAPAEESQGTNESRWILGNRFVYQEVKGTSMGQPFEGIGIIGYDNVRGEYTAVWLDNMMTGIVKSVAQFDAAEGALMENGTVACPMTGEKDKAFRAVLKFVDDDHHTYEMYTKDKDGNEFLSMEIAYERIQ
jgi:hypothetical protein